MMEARGKSYADWLGEKPAEPAGPTLDPLLPFEG